MSDCRIVKALELIHQAKERVTLLAPIPAGQIAIRFRDARAALDLAENELLTLKAELKRQELTHPAEDPAWMGPHGL